MKKNTFKIDGYMIAGLLIAIVTLAILLGLTSCSKQNEKGYRVNNLSGYDLTISTSNKVLTLKSPESIFFTSSSEPKFSTDADIKLRYYSLGTNPQITYNIDSYKNNFEVKVTGLADSVEIIINGNYYKKPLPFFYGTDNIPSSYNVISRPNKIDKVFTQVFKNGICIDVKEGICNLKGSL